MSLSDVPKPPPAHIQPRPIPRNAAINPFLAVVTAVIVFFLANFLAVSFLAIFLVTQGSSGLGIEEWLSTGLIGPFAGHLAVASTGIVLVYIVLRLLRTDWSWIGMKRPKPGDALYALVGYGWYFFLYVAASFLISALVPSLDQNQKQELGFSTDASGAALSLIFLSLVILPPIYEEILTRGLLFTGLRSKLSLPVAAIITSFLFAIAHLQWGGGAPLLWVAAIDTFILSLVLVYLREKSGSLWPAIGLHAIKNLVAFMLLFVFKVQ